MPVKVVDALLARPQYGERWARHWLDLVRYAETNGYERDGAKPNAWRYRDYVIDALNRERGRLNPIEPPGTTAFGEFVTRNHLGDPQDTRDAWRPNRRRERLYEELRAIDGGDLTGGGQLR